MGKNNTKDYDDLEACLGRDNERLIAKIESEPQKLIWEQHFENIFCLILISD